MKKARISLDLFVDMPREMKKYLKNYGYHFNKKAYEYAVKNMYKQGGAKVETIEKEKVQEMFKKHNITLENDNMYDSTYLYAMAQADFVGKAFNDEKTILMWIKCVIDDEDQSDGFIFNRWIADCMFNGIGIEWDELV